MKKLKITKHAYKRAKKRLGWSKKTLDRMAEKIYNEIKAEDDGRARIYGDFIYVFDGIKLVTVYSKSKRGL